jgi:hypothetical protein
MKITPLTIEALKSFAQINQNIVIKSGQPIRTIAPAKNVLAEFTPTEEFPVTFGIYDLNEFLASLSLVDDAELEFADKSVTIKNDSSNVKYYFSEVGNLSVPPEKNIEMPSTDVTVTITDDHLAQIRKVSSILKHTECAIVGSGNKATLTVLDTNDKTANTFDMELSDVESTLDSYSFIFNIPNLKVMQGDYKVSLSKALISHWENTVYDVSYHVALEVTSEVS